MSLVLAQTAETYYRASSILDKLASYSYTALTAGGAQWVRKALHPAESTIKAPQCPSRGVKPTATQETISTFVLEPPPVDSENPASTWDCRITVKNDPLCPVEILRYNSIGETQRTWATVLNQSYTPVDPYGLHSYQDYQEVVENFQNACEQYRQTALSITGHFVGASLSDQGSIIAAQMSDPCALAAHAGISLPTEREVMPLVKYFAQPLPSSDTLVLGTSPYVTSAKEGFYMPMKMEHPEVWHSTDQLYRCCRGLDRLSAPSVKYTQTIAYPYGAAGNSNIPICWLAPLDENVGVIWLKGLARTTSFRMTLRIAIEMMTTPTSTLASFCEPPALPDNHALAMYYEIASRLKDAYPAKDNATGKLWDKIKAVASDIWEVVSPALAKTQLAPVVGAVDVVRGIVKKATSRVDNAAALAAPVDQQKAMVSKAAANIDKAGWNTTGYTRGVSSPGATVVLPKFTQVYTPQLSRSQRKAQRRRARKAALARAAPVKLAEVAVAATPSKRKGPMVLL